MQKNTTQMKEQVRNTEVQMNEEKTGKLLEKSIQNNDSKDDQKTLKTKQKKCKNHLTNLEGLNNKYIETNNTITEIKNTL